MEKLCALIERGKRKQEVVIGLFKPSNGDGVLQRMYKDAFWVENVVLVL